MKFKFSVIFLFLLTFNMYSANQGQNNNANQNIMAQQALMMAYTAGAFNGSYYNATIQSNYQSIIYRLLGVLQTHQQANNNWQFQIAKLKNSFEFFLISLQTVLLIKYAIKGIKEVNDYKYFYFTYLFVSKVFSSFSLALKPNSTSFSLALKTNSMKTIWGFIELINFFHWKKRDKKSSLEQLIILLPGIYNLLSA